MTTEKIQANAGCMLSGEADTGICFRRCHRELPRSYIQYLDNIHALENRESR